jgi:hypothetical protein
MTDEARRRAILAAVLALTLAGCSTSPSQEWRQPYHPGPWPCDFTTARPCSQPLPPVPPCEICIPLNPEPPPLFDPGAPRR